MYSAEWRKPAPKGNILYDSIYRAIWKRKHSRLGECICGCQDGGGGGVDSRGMRGDFLVWWKYTISWLWQLHTVGVCPNSQKCTRWKCTRRRESFIVCESCLHKSSLKRKEKKEKTKKQGRGERERQRQRLKPIVPWGQVANTQLIEAFKVNSLFYGNIFHNILQKNSNFSANPVPDRQEDRGSWVNLITWQSPALGSGLGWGAKGHPPGEAP